MSLPEAVDQVASDPQAIDADVSKPRPPQPASGYKDSAARHPSEPSIEGRHAVMPTVKPNDVLIVEDLILDPSARHVTRADRKINLRNEEFELLHLLMQHAGEWITSDQLAEQAWASGLKLETRLLNVYFNNL